MTEIALFPLSAVLLPYGRMPLQIFEQRYLELVKSSMRSGDSFGMLRIERGVEVGSARLPVLAGIGTLASIVDWDQLENGLLGVTVEGGQRFRLGDFWRENNGLLRAEVELLPPLEHAAMIEAWEPMRTVLQGLEAHPHVQRMGMPADLDDAWQVAYSLVQLLPLEEELKVELLLLTSIEELMRELDVLLNALSGEA
ncbi:LON peptidase substrate-binding domain-containing protein [Congregibacter variabilis]|uniref:LON peptidase substrate-binding domain-containing protein n=1 Tax=Congregibacter variabilis TaxID=3081200 RepID=A0ABZ0I7W0_9GAMM|nr:LON peptidase substrate-binding domain-containing protein [Congregibacter sp. IMCC43200]